MCDFPRGSAIAGPAWPADASVTSSESGSSMATSAEAKPSLCARASTPFTRVRIALGRGSSRADERIAARNADIATDASRPWPTTSPIESKMRPSGSAMASYQSPPICSSRAAGA